MLFFRGVIAGFCLLAMFGCSSSYLVDKPEVLESCHSQYARDLSTAALIKAFKSKHWIIKGADLKAGLVRAEACRRSYCISVDAHVDDEGKINILRTPGQYVSGKGGKLLQRWIRNLAKAHNQYRCTDPETLRAEMRKQVFPPFQPIKPPEQAKSEKK